MDQELLTAIADPEKGGQSWHEAGNLVPYVIQVMAEKIESRFPGGLTASAETGCGKSTILLSHLSKRHICFTLGGQNDNSLDTVRSFAHFRPANVTFILGPSQQTLPTFAWDTKLDFALIDGAHAYPFPELDYFYFYPRLNPGAIFVIDDVHIPTISRLYEFMKEDDMFQLDALWGTTAFFTRTDSGTFPPYGDGWNIQNYNKARFPVDHSADRHYEE